MNNVREHLYTIIDPHGQCWKVTDAAAERVGLPTLLGDGWRPVRETPWHQSNYILILLEREPGDPGGFGFST